VSIVYAGNRKRRKCGWQGWSDEMLIELLALHGTLCIKIPEIIVMEDALEDAMEDAMPE